MLLLLAQALAQSAPPPVVGGEEAPEGSWPDAAAVYFGNQVGCTGTLIAPNLVLTAGHCAGGISAVKVGTVDYTTGGEQIRVRETIEYPDSQRTYDVSLLILDRDATAEPRPLALGCVLDEYLYDGAPIAIVGYGAINAAGTRYPTHLYQAFSVVTDADCSDTSTGCQRSVSPNGEVAAGGDGVDSCYGDSGGPLYLDVDGEYYLVGVTSRGVNGSSNCGLGGIYVRPDAIRDWIESESGVTLPEPVCNSAPAPTADPITVVEGRTAYSQVSPNDADAGDAHTFAVTAPPAFGSASVDGDGRVTYDADGGPGDTTVDVAVTDRDGAVGLVTLAVHVEPKTDDPPAGDDTGTAADDDTGAPPRRDQDPGEEQPGGCGCTSRSGAGASWWLLAGLAALVSRRNLR